MIEAFTEAFGVSKGLADQIAQLDAALRHLQQGFTALQAQLATKEKEAEESKQQCQ